ncbi:MAG: porphobilinogen synthase [Verrucomicrobiales bacterium]|nr:porphobilinogen synthase [Verrucomicrobiales bacterium]
MATDDALMLRRRPRRRRQSPAVRALLSETRVTADDLVAPLFVHDGTARRIPVGSLPGVDRLSLDGLEEECRVLAELGVRAVALFPVTPPELKDPEGRESANPDNLVCRAVARVKRAVPQLVVITDVALDPYTSHGHDGVLDPGTGDVDNDRTVGLLARMAVVQAAAGSDWVAPSDMMDGRVGAIRRALDGAGHERTLILAYSAKFASAFYGPFRDAVGSKSAAGGVYLDKRTYQLNPANPREALADALLDEEEGADLLMVKPAGPYLDIIRAVRESTRLPVVAYQVSGEYAALHAAAERGWLDLAATRDESLLAIKRAGADLILTYFARAAAEAMRA